MADNYTALKSSQKKRYISEETFSSLDLSKVPVGSEYEVISPIKKGDLSADINNALNKAEKSTPEPTNQTTGSDGDVLVKKGGGSEWKTIKVLPDTPPSVGEVLGCTTDGTPEWVPGVLEIYNHYMSFETASGEKITLTKISTDSSSFSSIVNAYQGEMNYTASQLGDPALLIPVVGSVEFNSQQFSAIAITGDAAILFYESGNQIDISDLINWADEPIPV